MNTLTKGLIMTGVSFVATAISTTGIPSTTLAWEILGITTAGTLLGYFAQSAAFPSTSVLGDLNSKDFMKGLLVALSNFLSSLGAAWATATVINWKETITGAVMVIVMYIVKQLASKPTGIPPTK